MTSLTKLDRVTQITLQMRSCDQTLVAFLSMTEVMMSIFLEFDQENHFFEDGLSRSLIIWDWY